MNQPFRMIVLRDKVPKKEINKNLRVPLQNVWISNMLLENGVKIRLISVEECLFINPRT